MAKTAEPALELPVCAYTALQAVQTLKAISMPTPALRKSVRRPMRSTRKAQPRETRKHQMVSPPLINAWSEPL